MTLDAFLKCADGSDDERITDPDQIIALLRKVLALPLNRLEIYKRIPNSRGYPIESTLYVLYRQNILNPENCTDWQQIMSRLQVCDLLVLFQQSIQTRKAPSLEPIGESGGTEAKDPGNMLERLCQLAYYIN